MRWLIVILVLVLPVSSSAERLLTSNSLEYVGAFRVPSASLGYGGTTLAYSSAGNGGAGSLYIGGMKTEPVKTMEISIPTPIISSTASTLNVATALQDQTLHDISEGNSRMVGVDGSDVGSATTATTGLLVKGSELLFTTYTIYDGTPVLQNTHATSGLTLATQGDFSGYYRMDVGDSARHIGGYLGDIPAEHQAAFQGDTLSGLAGISTVGTASSGPSIFSFDSADLGVVSPVPVLALADYPLANPINGNIEVANSVWVIADWARGIVFPDGSDTVLVFGRHGNGEYCYGYATDDPELAGTLDPGDGTLICYDPAYSYSAKGEHMYPYSVYVWAFSVSELMRVKNNEIEPYEANPYATWSLPVEFIPEHKELGGVAYDAANQNIYLSAPAGDSNLPVIHVFHVNLSATAGQLGLNPTGGTFSLNAGGSMSLNQ